MIRMGLLKARRVAWRRRGIRRSPTIPRVTFLLIELALTCSAANAEPWRIEPRLLLRETWTDNVGLQPKQSASSDWLTEIAPGVAVRGTGVRTKLDLDYQLTQLVHARTSSGNELQNSLNARGSAEVIERFLFLDALAQINQQTVSAFRTQPSSSTSDTTNRSETRLFSLSPYIKGHIGSYAAYDLRLTQSFLRTKADLGIDSNVRKWNGRVANPDDRAPFGWLVEYRDEKSSFSDRSDTNYELLRGTISYRFDPQFRAFVRGGWEKNDFLPDDQSNATHGAGFEWSASPRTQLTAEADRRYFGHSYLVSLRHRTPFTASRLAFTRDASTTTERLIGSSGGSVFDQLMGILAPRVPDPVQRAEQVRQLISLMGRSEQSSTQAGFLSNQVFVDTRADASVAWTGMRNTISLNAWRSRTRPLLPVLLSDVDFLNASSIEQVGFRLDWGHKVSPLTSASASAVWQRSTGDSATSLRTDLWTLNLFLNRQVRPKTFLSAGFRSARSNAENEASYRENALLASVLHQF